MIYILLSALAISILYGLVVSGLNFVGPLRILAVKQLEKDDPKQYRGAVLFYGASNFARWKNMQESFPDFPVLNHGFGGSTDPDLIRYADRLLYPYQPEIVVFQTGSNDYVLSPLKGEELLADVIRRKKAMFEEFHKHLPQAHFVIMSGLLLPGRSQYRELTEEVNRVLSRFCEDCDYCTFVNAEEVSYDKAKGTFRTDLFVKDMIHLNEKGQKAWADGYIRPELEKLKNHQL